MAVGVDTIKTTGRLIFDLERDEEKTTRSIEIPFPLTDTDSGAIQTAVNTANSVFTDASTAMNIFMQPSTWRDTNITEEQWVTKGVRYEIVTTTTRPVTPDSPDTLAAASHDQQGEAHEEQQS